MSSVTTAPGLLSLDPIQGLVDYVADIKPFHTKIFEVLFEYVNTDAVNTTVVDNLKLDIEDNQSYYTSTVDPAQPYFTNVNNVGGGVTSNALWFNPTNNTLYLRNQANTAWVILETHVLTNPNSGGTLETTITEFMETVAFDWTGTYTYPIVSANSTTNSIVLAGNISNALKPEDITAIVGSAGNNGPHVISSSAFDPISNTTTVFLDTVPSSVGGGTFEVQNVDITYWYEFSIVGVNSSPPSLPSQASSASNIGNPSDTASARSLSNFVIGQSHAVLFPQQSGEFLSSPTITVRGNATTSIQVGAEFLVQGSGGTPTSTPTGNDALYHATFVQYLPLVDQTVIGVNACVGVPTPTLVSQPGGMVVPYRFIAQTSGGTYDNTGYDSGSFDKSAGSIIYTQPE